MAEDDARAALDALIRERGDDYASLSRLLGRNAAYIQQFIHRGTPRRLAENDRRVLADYFGVSERRLGAPPPPQTPAGLIAVPRYAVGASAGSGAFADDEHAAPPLGFRRDWLRGLAAGPIEALSIIRVEGDSMTPTLADGDEILVDTSDGAGRLRDGVYVLRREDALMVKRLALDPTGRRLAIRSDNAAYESWPDCDPEQVTIIGRVIWAGRRLR